MSLIHKLSSEALLAELDLFSVPPTQLSIDSGYETTHRPLASLQNPTEIRFSIPTSSEEYILLHESYLYLKIQLELTNVDNSEVKLEHWTGVCPTNNLMHSMIKHVDLKLNDKTVIYSSNAYPYRAYLETLLGFSADAKNSHLSSVLWTDSADERANYFLPRANSTNFKLSQPVDMYGRLFLDLGHQGKALLGGMDICIEVQPQPLDFFFKWSTSVKLSYKILDACMHIHRLYASPKLILAHQKALALSPAKYPIVRNEVKTIILQSGTIEAMLDNIVLGQLPRRMFMCFVSHSAFSGSQSSDPFVFKNYKLSHAVCYLDGKQYPTNPYTPDFNRDLYVREYIGLFQALNQNAVSSTINIKRSEFRDSKMILGFNFAPDLSNGCGDIGHVNPIKRGTLRVYLRFSEPLEEIINAVLFCEYDNIIEIDANRHVTTDFN